MFSSVVLSGYEGQITDLMHINSKYSKNVTLQLDVLIERQLNKAITIWNNEACILF